MDGNRIENGAQLLELAKVGRIVVHRHQNLARAVLTRWGRRQVSDRLKPVTGPRGRGRFRVRLGVGGRVRIRIWSGWRHTNHEAVQEDAPPEREPSYETTPFEKWGETQCLSAAARVAAKHVNDELDTEEVKGGITSLGEGEDRAAIVLIETTLNRNGELVHKPSVAFDALVTATPATVVVTYYLDDLEYQMDAPVYAQHDVCQLE